MECKCRYSMDFPDQVLSVKGTDESMIQTDLGSLILIQITQRNVPKVFVSLILGTMTN